VAQALQSGGDLSQQISRQFSKSYRTDLLQRSKASRSQVGLNFEERRKNVAKVFQVTPEGAGYLTGCKVLLVDDVLTTGATAGSCAAVLKKAGAARVDVLAFALFWSPSGLILADGKHHGQHYNLYTRTCGYCYSAKSLLMKKGLPLKRLT